MQWTPSNPAEGGAQSLTVRRVRAGAISAAVDRVAQEVPVALEFNGVSQAVMLATPLDLADFALGFSLSEGLIEGRHELHDFEEEAGPLGITLRLQVSSAAFARLKDRRRSMAGRTGCGLCGTESLEHVARPLTPLHGQPVHRGDAISHAMGQLSGLQPLQQMTGAVHAAAWCSAGGTVQCLREDVGRHNALDKLIGALATARVDASTGFIVVTSRASFEMVHKAVTARVPLLAAVSAPTALAVATAEAAGLTLVGFARQHDLVVYANPQHLALDIAPSSTPETAHAR